MFIIGLVCMPISLLVVGDIMSSAAASSVQWNLFPLVVASFAAIVLYYSVLEGLWGASAGKLLCGLRVAGPDRNPPGIPKAMLRAAIFVILPAVPAWVTVGFDPVKLVDQYAAGWLNYLVLLLLFATARRRNGFAAVHDLLTGTRVIRRMAYEARPVMSPPIEARPLAENQLTVGPYHILGTLESNPAGDWLLG